MENPPFYSFAIVVWQGIVCQYGSIRNLALKGDTIVLANDTEVKSYKAANV